MVTTVLLQKKKKTSRPLCRTILVFSLGGVGRASLGRRGEKDRGVGSLRRESILDEAVFQGLEAALGIFEHLEELISFWERSISEKKLLFNEMAVATRRLMLVECWSSVKKAPRIKISESRSLGCDLGYITNECVKREVFTRRNVASWYARGGVHRTFDT